MMKINIAKDFSTKPFGRYAQDGQWSAERFRKEHLIPAFNSNDDAVEVLLDEVSRGFGSSFLEESFAGLIREGISYEQLKLRLKIITTQEDYKIEIWQYIEQAAKLAA